MENNQPIYNKEAIYDAEIAPLVDKLIEVCKKNEMPMFSSFCYGSREDGVDFCTTLTGTKDNWVPQSFKDCKSLLLRNPDFVAMTISSGGKK